MMAVMSNILQLLSECWRWIPWNKGRLVGPKPPFKLREIWAIRIRFQIGHRGRELALFNLAIDSKLRAVTWWLCGSAMSPTGAGP